MLCGAASRTSGIVPVQHQWNSGADMQACGCCPLDRACGGGIRPGHSNHMSDDGMTDWGLGYSSRRPQRLNARARLKLVVTYIHARGSGGGGGACSGQPLQVSATTQPQASHLPGTGGGGATTTGPDVTLYPQSYLSPGGGTWVRPMPFSLPQGLVRPGNQSPDLSLALRLSNRWTNHSVKALSTELPLPWGRYMGSAHAVFAPPGFGTPRESIPRSLACASAVQPLDQPFRQSSIHRATSPPGAVHGFSPCRFRSPRVWYAPGINPPISRLRFGCPTAGPTIPS